MSKFSRMTDGDPVLLEMGRYKPDNFVHPGDILNFACCDCGMVHIVSPVPVGENEVNLHFWSKPRSTAQLRRAHYGTGALVHVGKISGRRGGASE